MKVFILTEGGHDIGFGHITRCISLYQAFFWNIPDKNIKDNIESIMITFGGSDTRNMTPKILTLLVNRYPVLMKNIVIGKEDNNIKEIEKLKDEKTELFYHPDAEVMKTIILKSDIAISSFLTMDFRLHSECEGKTCS